MLRGLGPRLGILPIFIDIQALSVLAIQTQAAKLYSSTVNGVVAGHNHCFLLFNMLLLKTGSAGSCDTSCLQGRRRETASGTANRRLASCGQRRCDANVPRAGNGAGSRLSRRRVRLIWQMLNIVLGELVGGGRNLICTLGSL
jgi:hypothetical protein